METYNDDSTHTYLYLCMYVCMYVLYADLYVCLGVMWPGPDWISTLTRLLCDTVRSLPHSWMGLTDVGGLAPGCGPHFILILPQTTALDSGLWVRNPHGTCWSCGAEPDVTQQKLRQPSKTHLLV